MRRPGASVDLACAVFGVDGVNGDHVQDTGSAQTLFLLKAVKAALAVLKPVDSVFLSSDRAWHLRQAPGQDRSMSVNPFCTGDWTPSCGSVWGAQ
jgi:hypothetical protein